MINKVLISHRGNINGKNVNRENTISYIEEAFVLGYDVEVDVWTAKNVDGKVDIFLGHDNPETSVDLYWLFKNCGKLWIHCKNLEAVEYFDTMPFFNYFWHENDTVTLTSKRFIWAYPNKQPIKNSIAVLPELHNDDVSSCLGICSDYIQNYKI